MITQKELKPILRKIEEKTLDNRCEDIDILIYNIENNVFNQMTTPLSDGVKFAIRQSAVETLEACHSLCINHDAAVIKAVLEYIRKSL